MFTGIIETLGKVIDLKKEAENLHLTIKAPFTPELKIDQSIAHNGVCLTVVNISEDTYIVTAIKETLDKTNLSQLKTGDAVNLERCIPVNGRLDGHIVQGHVDQTAICRKIEDTKGSWKFTFQFDDSTGNITVEKGSVSINGVSLTVMNSVADEFSVAIIPYTYEHTNFKYIKEGTIVNIEFDIIGKYVAKLLEKL